MEVKQKGLAADPVALENHERIGGGAGTDAFRRYSLRGRFLYSGEQLLLEPRTPPSTAAKNGSEKIEKIGAYVFTPFLRTDSESEGEIVLVNRGWVGKRQSEGLAGNDLRDEGDEIELIVVRSRQDNPGIFAPSNSPAEKRFRWQDLGAMRAASGLPSSTQIVDCVGMTNPSSPKLKLRDAESLLEERTIPFTHAVYAVTWYSLAAAGIVMTRRLLKV